MIDTEIMPILNVITIVYRAQTIIATLYHTVWLVREAAHQEAVHREAVHQEAVLLEVIKVDAQEEVTLAGARYGALKAVALAQRATNIKQGTLINRPLFALAIIKICNI